jgi:hypothetical protein
MSIVRAAKSVVTLVKSFNWSKGIDPNFLLLVVLSVGVGMVSIPAALVVFAVLAYVMPMVKYFVEEYAHYAHQHNELALHAAAGKVNARVESPVVG